MFYLLEMSNIIYDIVALSAYNNFQDSYLQTKEYKRPLIQMNGAKQGFPI